MTMVELAVVLVAAAIGWLWLDGMRAREIATGVGKRVCGQDGVQFLDDTVAFVSMGVKRDNEGRLQVRRTYQFEFSDTGDNRRKGSVVVLGRRIETVYLEPYSAVIPLFPE